MILAGKAFFELCDLKRFLVKGPRLYREGREERPQRTRRKSIVPIQSGSKCGFGTVFEVFTFWLSGEIPLPLGLLESST
jgi:hypothetical protein